jgi:hypothetical protein
MPDSEFFALHESEIDQRLLDEGPDGGAGSVEAGNIHTIELAALAGVLGIGDPAEVELRLEEDLRVASHYEASLLVIPRALLDALASADELTLLAERWTAASKELRRDGWSTAEVAALLSSLRTLAQDAAGTGRDVALWISL